MSAKHPRRSKANKARAKHTVNVNSASRSKVPTYKDVTPEKLDQVRKSLKYCGIFLAIAVVAGVMVAGMLWSLPKDWGTWSIPQTEALIFTGLSVAGLFAVAKHFHLKAKRLLREMGATAICNQYQFQSTT